MSQYLLRQVGPGTSSVRLLVTTPVSQYLLRQVGPGTGSAFSQMQEVGLNTFSGR